MAFPTLIRSRTIYQASEGRTVESVRPRLAERIQAGVDSLIEYPGSIKGEGGWWRLTEWMEHKIDQSLKRRGERM